MKLIRISAIWCTSCIITYNNWLELKDIYPNLEFIEYDYDTDDVSAYNIGNILPVIIIIKEQQEITRIIGEKSKEEIINIIDKIR